MDKTWPAGPDSSAIRDESGKPAAPGAVEWLSLAPTPAFAAMALLTAVFSGGPMAAMCPTAQGASPLTGMVPMYLLMSAFHAGPWVKLISGRRSGVGRS
jgi:hypothetical protein